MAKDPEAPEKAVSVVVHERLGDITQAAWEDLRQRMHGSGVFQSYAWHRAVAESCDVEDGLHLVCVRDEDRYLAIAPFFRSRRGSARVLRLVGDTCASTCDIIVDSGRERVLRDLFAHICGHHHVADEVQFGSLPPQSPTVRVATQFHTDQQLLTRVDEAPHRNVLSIESALSGLHGCEQDGVDVFHLSDQETILPLLNDFFTQHIQSGLDGHPSPFVSRRNRDFCRSLVEALSTDGALLLTVLRCSGHPVAFHLGFVDQNVLVWHQYASSVDASRQGLERTMFRALAAYAQGKALAGLDVTRAGESVRSLSGQQLKDRVSVTLSFPGASRSSARAKAFSRLSDTVQAVSTWSKAFTQAVYVMFNAQKVVGSEQKAFSVDDTAEQFYDHVVADWTRTAELQKPERTVLKELRGQLRHMRMLDIGVGAGRTSVYFAPLVREYVAVDVSQNMVKACRDLLGDYVPASCFAHGDARNMQWLADHSFDFILFSFNGIDCVSAEDRTSVFREVKRLAKDGAWFCFSSHNLGSLTWRGATSAGHFLHRLRRYRLLSAANPGLRAAARQPSASIVDGGHHYRLPLFYTTGSEQVRRLEDMGFRDIRVLSLHSGETVSPADPSGNCGDSWLYYLCRA